ncbi:MAG TPA: flagellar hook capping protein [Peptococcaceae bacterium]|nr:MAG: Flagellar hook capping protein [Clostridia bacterium 41_269]HBT20167.1 flagellar hook capping protein [Peptococcaceae bacterium]
MSVSSIASSYLTQTASSSSTNSAESQGILGKDDFLKILVAQLKFQNPLEPMDDEEFISQLTQFSILEQITGIREELQELKSSLKNGVDGQYALGIQALNMIGKRIKALIDGTEVEGIVEAVKNFNSQPVLIVGEKEIPLGSVVEVHAE